MAKNRVEAGPSVHDPEPVYEAEPEEAPLEEQAGPVTTAQPEPEEPPEPEVPLKSAPKAAWVEYAVAQGEDRADVETWTKGDIVEVYGE